MAQFLGNSATETPKVQIEPGNFILQIAASYLMAGCLTKKPEGL
jgi:hypothetical protein